MIAPDSQEALQAIGKDNAADRGREALQGRRGEQTNPVDGPLEKWAPDSEIVKATVRFLQQRTRMAAKSLQKQND